MQQRKQSFEENDDGCVDEVNIGVGFHPSSKPTRESDSQLLYTPIPSKR